MVERHEPTLIASTEPTAIPQATVVANAAIGDVETATAAESAPQKATDTTASRDEPKTFIVAALPDSSQVVPPEAPSAERAQASTPDPAPEKAADTTASLDEPKPFVVASTDPSQVFSPEEVTTAPDNALPAVSTIEINEECLVAEICIDRYLWALYERAPKIDAIKVHERRKVTVKRKGKTVTVTRTFTRRVDEEFGWKDPKAAEKVGMTMMDYVIGGMDRSFKIKLFHTLHAAEQAGLQPGITSAFRDDYRQSIATGLKAATDRSYHGGSTRGGYGRGLAADIVSVKGATRGQRWVSTEKLWKWIDDHGKEFGIGRPYLNRDPPHVAPIDGKEYASRRGGAKTQDAEAKTKTRVAESTVRKGKRLAARGEHSTAKRARTVKLSKGAKTAKLSKGRTM
ncbi:peptidase M15 [Bradyrhizobium sp. 190]|nr:peptidase M15 [Bradyrhizobium sp. 190]